MNKVKNKEAKHYELYKDTEAIDVIKKVLTEEEYLGYLKGNVLKYQLRLGKKDSVKKDSVKKDIIKISDYKDEIEHTSFKLQGCSLHLPDKDVQNCYNKAFKNLNFINEKPDDTQQKIDKAISSMSATFIEEYYPYIYKGFANTMPVYSNDCMEYQIKYIKNNINNNFKM